MISRNYKVWLAASCLPAGQVISAETHRQRIRTVRQFSGRIIEWDWPDAPPRNPVIAGDVPKKPDPLPKFLDDRDAAGLMAAARASADPRDRLVVELLARTGMRAGELASLDAGAVVQIGNGRWLRIPLGKLRYDRYVRCTPNSSGCSSAGLRPTWSTSAATSGWSPTTGGVLDRHVIGRTVRRVARAAGVAGVHPHRLRHTLATQRSTAACGWRPSPPCSATRNGDDADLRPDRQPGRRRRVRRGQRQDRRALRPAPRTSAGYESAGMARLRREAHARMLGNGLCTRPPELDCCLESACETCAYFRTGTQFLPILARQRDHARDQGQADRAALFDGLIQRAETERS